jgi:tRNA(Ile)-lysidine synthase
MASTRNSSSPVDPDASVAACLARHVRPGERLVAGLSGGVDSAVLLHLLQAHSRPQGFRLSALHVHHGLSPHADAWLAHCQRLCDSLGVPLEVARVEVRRNAASGPEAAARQARYAAFSKVEAEWVLLAHQRDDQAETLLFNLLRGAGLGGAAAMPVVRAFPGRRGLRILRPLLDMPRSWIERYAGEHNLAWIEDESNHDERHARNYLRQSILPRLLARFPGCDAVLARAAAHFAEADTLLSRLAEIDAAMAMREGRVVVAELARLDEARARNLLRHVLKQAGVTMPDRARLQEALRQACDAAADRQVSIDLGQCMLHRHRGQLWLAPKHPLAVDTEWRGEAALDWAGTRMRFDRTRGAGIGLARLEGKAIWIRPRQGGERFQPDPKRPRRELRKLLQESGVPPWQRRAMPLLWCGEQLVWVPGLGVDVTWQCREGEPGLLPYWGE